MPVTPRCRECRLGESCPPQSGFAGLSGGVRQAGPAGLDIGLIAAMRDNTNRDAFIAANMGNSGEALQRVLAQLRGTRDRPDDAGRAAFIADLSAVAAIFAYRNGDGATAQICLDRGLRAEPKHNLSHLLVAAISTGLDPQALDALVAPEDPPRGPLNRRRFPG